MAVAERRLREKEARRAQILDAARDLFLQKGFESTTIDEIADRTELSKGAIYLHFPSKEEIYITLMLEGSQILYQMMREAVSADLPADTLLRRLGQSYFRFYREYTAYFRMLFLYMSSQEVHAKITSELCEKCESSAKQALSLVTSTIQAGIDSGIFHRCDPWEQALMTWSSLNGIILLGERGDDQHLQLGTSIERLLDLYMETMISALKIGR
jgi:AcrR family transcriptional regulator